MLREICGRAIGPDSPVFVIAEIGLNHGGSPARAVEMVDAAAAAGASAIKLQTIVADRLVAASCPPPAHVETASLQAFFARFELDFDAHRAVVDRARHHRLAVLSTPFSEDVLPMLESLDLDGYKIASGDLTYHRLIAAAARTGRPLILSTGMSSLAEVRNAVDAARSAGADALGVLHCVSAYPAPPRSQNLRAVGTLAAALKVPVGLSDHGSDTSAAIPAVALGACIYERHLVLDDDVDAIDRAVSSTPRELKAAIAAMEHTRIALGDGRKVCQPAERVNLRASRRGLYARQPLRAGQRLTGDDLIALRPVTDLAPSAATALVGSVLTRNVAAGAPIHASDLAEERAS
jgi:N,N'-diacetyllegionaminate synthase